MNIWVLFPHNLSFFRLSTKLLYNPLMVVWYPWVHVPLELGHCQWFCEIISLVYLYLQGLYLVSGGIHLPSLEIISPAYTSINFSRGGGLKPRIFGCICFSHTGMEIIWWGYMGIWRIDYHPFPFLPPLVTFLLCSVFGYEMPCWIPPLCKFMIVQLPSPLPHIFSPHSLPKILCDT